MKDENSKESFNKVSRAIRLACQTQLGVIDTHFLCQSVGLLDLKEPLCVDATATIGEVIATLKKNKVGSVLVVDKAGLLRGIFTERDLVLKFDQVGDLSRPIAEIMTPEPVAQTPDCSLAFALHLMSHGGFRHLPITDPEGFPIAVVSVKDIVDVLVEKLLADVLNFPVE